MPLKAAFYWCKLCTVYIKRKMQTPPAQKIGDKTRLLSPITAVENTTATKGAKVIYLVTGTAASTLTVSDKTVSKAARIIALKQKPLQIKAPLIWMGKLVERVYRKCIHTWQKIIFLHK